MQHKLFPNIKKMTRIFSIAILAITLVLLLLRLTVFHTMMPKEEEDSAQSSEFQYEINDYIVFNTATSLGKAQIRNLENNTADMQVTIFLEGNKHAIYSSGWIPPGKDLGSIKLQPGNSNLTKGTHPCTAKIVTKDPVTKRELDTITESITIEIQNDPL